MEVCLTPFCTAAKADGSACAQPAMYACHEGHVLCGNHAKRLGGPLHRRKTDRRCAICRSMRILCLNEEPVALERRGIAHRLEESATMT